MDKILQSLSSGEWWFSVVAAGLIVGVAGTYLVRVLDSCSGKLTGIWANRSVRVQEARTKQVDELVRFRHRIPFVLAERNNLQLDAVWNLLLSGVALILSALTLIQVQRPLSWSDYGAQAATGMAAIILGVLAFKKQLKSLELTLTLIELRCRLDVEQIRSGQ
ncbi:hypothetical protein [Burkholderia ambifaria]|uniref:hypothetical protein n=1 Tax=Burkholderia ambifaria TaxID=152480 RepID=UPI000FD6861E|nr:hypothetical protein [Burkholderia ambifaria]MBR7928752.1 hypothetical protein [Burkholderia ambifaria]QQC05521.1 hypothetical protein I6H84_06360 [Burkholderia ambifaria]UZU03699.1 hypothetical protein OR987_25865 [Burkholderia ambifaria]UZU10251.1 hypothetical protein OR988_25860 [Burkholderia ambifaria]WDS14133.1 hypothetical protein OR984_25825 [Burkholderia ambifaria]